VIPRERFFEYVQEFVQLTVAFEQAAGLSDLEVREFASMALPLTEQQGSNEQGLP
jgi:hypothetical protein